MTDTPPAPDSPDLDLDAIEDDFKALWGMEILRPTHTFMPRASGLSLIAEVRRLRRREAERVDPACSECGNPIRDDVGAYCSKCLLPLIDLAFPGPREKTEDK